MSAHALAADPPAAAPSAAVSLAAIPLAAALLALAAVYAAGLDRNVDLPPRVASLFYGFFLDRYPLFAFALVYALARVLAVALRPGTPGLPRRVLGVGLGAGLVLGLGLYPTFGGLVLRGGFVTGGMAFLNGVPMAAAYGLGAGVSAAALGLAMGLGVLAAGGGFPPHGGGRLRGLAARLGGGLARFLALWFALAMLGAARDWGVGGGVGLWPLRPLGPVQAGLAALWLAAAFLPHAGLVARAGRKAA